MYHETLALLIISARPPEPLSASALGALKVWDASYGAICYYYLRCHLRPTAFKDTGVGEPRCQAWAPGMYLCVAEYPNEEGRSANSLALGYPTSP
jgi:hypothetical protein